MLSLFSWFPTGIQNLVQHFLIPMLSLCHCYVNYQSKFWSHRVLCELDLQHTQTLFNSYVISISWFPTTAQNLVQEYVCPNINSFHIYYVKVPFD